VALGSVAKNGARLIALSPDGTSERVIYEADPDGVAMLDFPVWSADGQFIYFVQQGAADGLWRIPTTGEAKPEQILSGRLVGHLSRM